MNTFRLSGQGSDRKVEKNMKKVFLALLLVCAVVSMAFANGAAEDAAASYPERSISLIVPAKTGGDVDQVARILASELTK